MSQAQAPNLRNLTIKCDNKRHKFGRSNQLNKKESIHYVKTSNEYVNNQIIFGVKLQKNILEINKIKRYNHSLLDGRPGD